MRAAIMYRAVLLCALVLLVAAPSITSVQGANVKFHGAGSAAGAGAADSIGARLLKKAGRALLAEGSVAVATKPAENVDSNSKSPVAGSAAGDAVAGQAAASPAAAAAPKEDAAAAQQPTSSSPAASNNQQPDAQQQQQQPRTPTVTQPAAPQPIGGASQQPAAVAPATPAAQQPAEPKPEQQQQQPKSAADSTVVAASSPHPTAEVMYTEPGVNKAGYKTGVQHDYAPSEIDHHNVPQPYSGQYPSGYNPTTPRPNPSYPAPGQHPSYRTNGPPGKYGEHDHEEEEEEEDYKGKGKHEKHHKNKHDKDDDDNEKDKKDKKHKKGHDDDEDDDGPGNKMHHTG